MFLPRAIKHHFHTLYQRLLKSGKWKHLDISQWFRPNDSKLLLRKQDYFNKACFLLLFFWNSVKNSTFNDFKNNDYFSDLNILENSDDFYCTVKGKINSVFKKYKRHQ